MWRRLLTTIDLNAITGHELLVWYHKQWENESDLTLSVKCGCSD